MCVGITILKWDSTCHSQTHGTEPPVHFCCSHYISSCFLSTPPFHSFSLSLVFSFSLSPSPFLSLSLSLYLCPLFLSVVARHMSSEALYQIFSSWSIILFHTISFHSSYKIPQLFTDYLLRLPSSKLLEKHLLRSRANRRLVLLLAGVKCWRVFRPLVRCNKIAFQHFPTALWAETCSQRCCHHPWSNTFLITTALVIIWGGELDTFFFTWNSHVVVSGSWNISRFFSLSGCGCWHRHLW